jgi:hypothetical protein
VDSSSPPQPPTDDVDLVLRHVSRLFPEQLARALVPAEHAIAVKGWLDTQVTGRQRRLDRALEVTVDGARRLLHVEWQATMTADVPFRVFEYHVLLALGLADELAAKDEATKGKKQTAAPPMPTIESTVVLLSGRDEPWPDAGAFRTSPSDGLFSGVQFRIEPVYQQTVEELEAKGSVLWLIFAPLAANADPQRMARVVDRIRGATSRREFEELSVAITVLADADKRKRGLRGAILSMLPEEMVMESWVFRQGVEKGKRETLTSLFERRFKRALTEAERSALAARITQVGDGRVEDVVLEMPADALAAWLADPNAA